MNVFATSCIFLFLNHKSIMNGRVRGDEKGNLFLRGNPTTSRNKIALNKNAASFYASSKSKYKIQVPHISQTNMDWTSSPPRTAKIDRRVSLNCHKSQHGKLKSDKSEHTPCVLSLHPCNQTPAFPATLFSSNAIL